MVSTCRWARTPSPRNNTDTIVTSATEIDMDRFRRRATQISLRMNCRRMALPLCLRGGGAAPVGAAHLVADQLAIVELDNALAQLIYDPVVVSGHHDRGSGAVDPVQQAHDLQARGRVEVARGLVGQQNRRLVDEGPRDRHPLLLASGELVRQPLLLVGETDHLEGLRHDRPNRLTRLTQHLQSERDVLEDGLVGQQPEVLEYGGDLATQLRHLAPWQFGQLASGHEHVARGRWLFAKDQAQQGGLARTGLTHDEHELAALDLEGDPAQRRLAGAPIDLGDVLEANHPWRAPLQLGVRTTPENGDRLQPRTCAAGVTPAYDGWAGIRGPWGSRRCGSMPRRVRRYVSSGSRPR